MSRAVARSRQHAWHELDAGAAVDMIEDLRRSELEGPAELNRYLDLLRSRAALLFGVDLDVGSPEAGTLERCCRTVSSLLRHGWARRFADGKMPRIGPALPRPRF